MARKTPRSLSLLGGAALVLAAVPAVAQHGGPRMPPGHPPMGAGPSQLGPDCVVVGMAIETTTRRTASLVDVSVRLFSPAGGVCYVRPEAVQLSTVKAGPVTRLFTEIAVDGEVQKPFATADQPGGDHARPWSAQLERGKTLTVTIRNLAEGDTIGGEPDAPGRVRVDLRQLGPRVFDGAPLTLHASADGGGAMEARLVSGDPKATPTVGSGPKASATIKLSKEGVLPFGEWKLTGPAPAATTAATATGGLGLVEALRDGLVRDLAEGLADPKDTKKVDAAWDAAFDAALRASGSSDGLVAGLGARSLAFLAAGLSPNVQKVHTDKDGDGALVPEAVAKRFEAGMKAFADATGHAIAPSPVSARSVRFAWAKLGLEPDAHKKAGEEGAKRLAKRLDKDDALPALGKLDFAFAKVTDVAPTTGKIVGWGMFGPEIVGEKPASIPGVASASKRGARWRLGSVFAQLTHGKGPAKALFGAFVLAGAGYFAWLAASRLRAKTSSPPAA